MDYADALLSQLPNSRVKLVPCGPFRSTHKIDFCLNSGPMI